ncbi:MAG: AMP-binding protein [Gammaproteobacteria bacterium]|nr:AMP-binding protein [Gammaproteobacteria bacterium]
MHSKLSYFHRGGESPLLGHTIPDYFAEIAARFPDREAVVSIPQDRRLNYAELSEQIDELARGLIGLGFGKGSRVGIWSTNNLEWLILQMATARIGAILVNINPAYRLHELDYVLQNSQLQCLFTMPAFKSSDYVGMLAQLLPALETDTADRFNPTKLPVLRRIVIYDPTHPMQTERPGSGFTTWQEVIEIGQDVEDLELITAALDRDDPINIQYTSGTTGFPKPVLLSHHNILNNAWFSAQAMHFSERDRLCIPVPFYHCFGMVLANLLCLSVGAAAVIACEHFDAEQVLSAIEQERCTAVHGVPTMFIAMLEHPDFGHFRLDSLRTGIMAGAPCPPSLMQRVMHDMHCPEILIGYGETEASPITHLTSRDDSLERRTKTVGKNLPHQEVKIIDIAGEQTVPLEQIGEVCFRGYHIMLGYANDSKATAEAINANGWLHSGDLGSMDADGYVRITGRLKEMIIRGGENIYPREIEDFIFTHPKVAAVAVFGIPDEFYGEEVVAWIRLHADTECSANEIREFCRDKLAHFKIPKLIEFVESFPMTVTGKLQKFRMREMTVEKQKNSAPRKPA